MLRNVFALILCGVYVALALDNASYNTTHGLNVDDRIVGGANVGVEHFPWQVSVTYYRNHRCGGSIIAPSYVLTAAHCTYRTIRGSVGVRAGTSYRNSGGIQAQVHSIVEYPLYTSRTNDYDISVIRLTHHLPIGMSIRPIALAERNAVLAPGTSALISGWGDTSETAGSSSLVLQFVAVPIVDAHVCAAAYVRHAPINGNMICAGFNGIGGRDACQGDSGGPLVYGQTLYGVVSFGIGCARPRYPGVYSRVSVYRQWIDEVMAKP